MEKCKVVNLSQLHVTEYNQKPLLFFQWKGIYNLFDQMALFVKRGKETDLILDKIGCVKFYQR